MPLSPGVSTKTPKVNLQSQPLYEVPRSQEIIFSPRIVLGVDGQSPKPEPKLLEDHPTVKNFFTLRVTEPWPRLPRGAVEFPALQIFKPHLDAVLHSLLWVTLLWQGLDWVTHRGPFQPLACWDPVILRG